MFSSNYRRAEAQAFEAPEPGSQIEDPCPDTCWDYTYCEYCDGRCCPTHGNPENDDVHAECYQDWRADMSYDELVYRFGDCE